MNRSASTAGRAARAGGVLLCLLLATPAPARAQVDPPLIGLAVCIEAALYVDNLPADARRQVEAAVARDLAASYAKVLRLGYVRWGGGTCGQPLPGAAGTLAVHVVQRPQGPGREVRLEYRMGDIDLAAQDVRFNDVLFKWYEEKHAHDADGLRRTVLARLQDHLRQEPFQAGLDAMALRRVPLSFEMRLKSGTRQLLVPLLARKVKAAPESVFSARFSVSDDPANLRMEVVGESPPGDVASVLQCRILEFTGRDSFTEEEVEQHWNQLQPLLANVRNVRIFMEKYHPDPNPGTSGGLVTDL